MRIYDIDLDSLDKTEFMHLIKLLHCYYYCLFSEPLDLGDVEC